MPKEKLKLQDHPYLCTPIVGKNKEELLTEIERVKIKKPDMIEWRVDYFQEIGNFQKVVEVAEAIKNNIKNIPLLFTIRSKAEGGNDVPISELEIVELLSYVCKSDAVDIIDYEIANPKEYTLQLREISDETNTLLLLSFHDFSKTPTNEELLEMVRQAKYLGADIAKLAVMPNNRGDVIRLLDVTNQANESLNIPVATMSLGSLGSLSRMVGWVFGSIIIFTVGENSSAPGQIPIEEMQDLLTTIRKYQN